MCLWKVIKSYLYQCCHKHNSLKGYLLFGPPFFSFFLKICTHCWNINNVWRDCFLTHLVYQLVNISQDRTGWRHVTQSHETVCVVQLINFPLCVNHSAVTSFPNYLIVEKNCRMTCRFLTGVKMERFSLYVVTKSYLLSNISDQWLTVWVMSTLFFDVALTNRTLQLYCVMSRVEYRANLLIYCTVCQCSWQQSTVALLSTSTHCLNIHDVFDLRIYLHTRHHVQMNSLITGFVQTLESPGILLFRIPGLESPGKGIGPGKPWKFLEF